MTIIQLRSGFVISICAFRLQPRLQRFKIRMHSALRHGLRRSSRGQLLGSGASPLALAVRPPAAATLLRHRRLSYWRLFSTADSSARVTAEDVQKWSKAQVAEWARAEVGLDDDDVVILEKQKISGKSLLGLSKADMKRIGLPVGAIDTLLSFINKLRDTGEKTVRINVADAGEDAIYERLTFNCAQDFKEFLRDTGAMGLKNGDGQGLLRESSYNRIKDGGEYTLEFAKRGFKA
jgi:Sterile alpha motif (SAM)/Pointed domain